MSEPGYAHKQKTHDAIIEAWTLTDDCLQCASFPTSDEELAKLPDLTDRAHEAVLTADEWLTRSYLSLAMGRQRVVEVDRGGFANWHELVVHDVMFLGGEKLPIERVCDLHAKLRREAWQACAIWEASPRNDADELAAEPHRPKPDFKTRGRKSEAERNDEWLRLSESGEWGSNAAIAEHFGVSQSVFSHALNEARGRRNLLKQIAPA